MLPESRVNVGGRLRRGPRLGFPILIHPPEIGENYGQQTDSEADAGSSASLYSLYVRTLAGGGRQRRASPAPSTSALYPASSRSRVTASGS